MDPFLNVIHLLRPRATLWAHVDAAGAWALSFRKRNDLLFCWVLHGQCQLTRPRFAPVLLQQNDFLLIRTSTPFTLTSGPGVPPQDSETLFAARKGRKVRLGSGRKHPVTLRGGRFLFDTANEGLLTGLLPQLLHLSAANDASPRVRALLAMNEAETLQPAPGSDFVIARLMELILVELLRAQTTAFDPKGAAPGPHATGLLAGLADPVVAQALQAMHRDVARPWTVASLARLCGVSRSTFAARFRATVGQGPIDYLLDWRMALARDALRTGTRTVAEIALAIGFGSASAFSTSFSRMVGTSPRQFARAAQKQGGHRYLP